MEAELHKRQSTQQALEDTKTDIDWQHQILSPLLVQSRITHLHTNCEVTNTSVVLDGDLDDLNSSSVKHGVCHV